MPGITREETKRSPCAKCGTRPRDVARNGYVYSYCQPCQTENWRIIREQNAGKPCARCEASTRLDSGSYCGLCKSELTIESALRHADKPCNGCGGMRAPRRTLCTSCSTAAATASKERHANDPCASCQVASRLPNSVYCRACGNDSARRSREKYGYLGKDQENGRRKYLCRRLARYGLSVDEYLALLATQNNSCAICGRDVTAINYIDHNHSTDEVRGILCSPCNQGLGIFEDEPTLLEVAAAYLRARQ